MKLSDFGPGLLLAATGIGVGDMVSSTIAGAEYGLTLVWALVAGVIDTTSNYVEHPEVGRRVDRAGEGGDQPSACLGRQVGTGPRQGLRVRRLQRPSVRREDGFEIGRAHV